MLSCLADYTRAVKRDLTNSQDIFILADWLFVLNSFDTSQFDPDKQMDQRKKTP